MHMNQYQQRVQRRERNARSSLAFVFRNMCRIGRLRSVAVRAVCGLEGGQMWSQTFRDLMRVFYGVEVGMHSYGDSIGPDLLPWGTRIGNYCSLAAGIVVFRRNHPTMRFSQHPFFFNAASGLVSDDTIEAVRDHPLEVGHDVWIGGNAIITPKCETIGVGAVIGAGAVVTKSVPPFNIVAGSPARVIGERFSPEIQEVLLESCWWEFPLARLVTVLPVFLEEATVENAERLRDHLRNPAVIA